MIVGCDGFADGLIEGEVDGSFEDGCAVEGSLLSCSKVLCDELAVLTENPDES